MGTYTEGRAGTRSAKRCERMRVSLVLSIGLFPATPLRDVILRPLLLHMGSPDRYDILRKSSGCQWTSDALANRFSMVKHPRNLLARITDPVLLLCTSSTHGRCARCHATRVAIPPPFTTGVWRLPSASPNSTRVSAWQWIWRKGHVSFIRPRGAVAGFLCDLLCYRRPFDYPRTDGPRPGKRLRAPPHHRFLPNVAAGEYLCAGSVLQPGNVIIHMKLKASHVINRAL